MKSHLPSEKNDVREGDLEEMVLNAVTKERKLARVRFNEYEKHIIDWINKYCENRDIRCISYTMPEYDLVLDFIDRLGDRAHTLQIDLGDICGNDFNWSDFRKLKAYVKSFIRFHCCTRRIISWLPAM